MAKPESTVTYRPGTNEALGAGWDVMHVVYQRENSPGVMHIANSFVIARDASGKIIRKTDIMLDPWEVVNDADELRRCQYCFDERDRLSAERAENDQRIENNERREDFGDVGEAT